MRRQPSPRSGSRRLRRSAVTQGEFDANLHRFDERMQRLFARSDERHQENVRSNERLLAEMDKRHASLLESFRVMFDRRLGDLNQRMDDFRAQTSADVDRIREVMGEMRKEWRLLRWNIWVAACATVIGIASFNSATTSAVLDAFESGRNTAAAIAEARHAAEHHDAPERERPP